MKLQQFDRFEPPAASKQRHRYFAPLKLNRNGCGYIQAWSALLLLLFIAGAGWCC
jgi:hypothetical protein